MASSSRKIKKGSKMLVRGVDYEAPNFKLSPTIVEMLDLVGAQSQILPKVLLVHNIRSYYKCSIQELGTHEMNEALSELCVNGILKPKHQHLEAKGLTHISHMPRNF